jgi:hypothetical protein
VNRFGLDFLLLAGNVHLIRSVIETAQRSSGSLDTLLDFLQDPIELEEEQSRRVRVTLLNAVLAPLGLRCGLDASPEQQCNVTRITP